MVFTEDSMIAVLQHVFAHSMGQPTDVIFQSELAHNGVTTIYLRLPKSLPWR